MTDPVTVSVSETGALEADAELRRSELARRGRRQVALFWGAAALSLLALAPFGPMLSAMLWACPFKELTGWPCPSCGLTRAALALARFDVLGALMRYPLQTLGWIGFIGGGLASSAWVLLGRDLPSLPRRLPRWSLVVGGLLVALNWAWSIHTGV